MIKNYDGNFWRYSIYIEYTDYEYIFPYVTFQISTNTKNCNNQIIPDAPNLVLKIGFWHWFVMICYCEDDEPEYKIIYDSFKWRPGEKDEQT